MGAWGSGKSTFLNQIKESISDDNSIICIDFNAWSAKTPTEILDDFFGLYNQTLSVCCPMLSNKIEIYAKTLIDAIHPDGNKWYNQISSLCEKKTNQTIYSEICDKLKRSKINVLVFIDDLDRLQDTEILEILRLIRNTANFPYTQFVVAYDKDYVVKSLGNKNVVNASEFLNKIFNTEIHLPTFKNDVIIDSLKEKLTCFFDKYDKLFIKDLDEEFQVLNGDNRLIPMLLKTERDVIRFTNSIIINLKHYLDNDMIDDVIIQDFFNLELIRFAFIDIYKILRTDPTKILEIYKKQYMYNQSLNSIHIENSLIKTLLIRLFSENNDLIKHGRLAYHESFHRYFMHNIDPKNMLYSNFLDILKSKTPILTLEEINKNKSDGEFALCLNKYISEIEKKTYTEEYPMLYSQLSEFVILLLGSVSEKITTTIIPVIQDHINKLNDASSSERKNAIIKLWLDILPLKTPGILDNRIIIRCILPNYLNKFDNPSDLLKLLRSENVPFQLSFVIKDFKLAG